MDSNDYDWPGSSRKPGLNRILIQSECIHGFCSSIPTATFRRDSGMAEEQVAKPACRKMGNLPKCMCFSCAVYMPWKSELHAEYICMWTAEVPFILVDSASDARGRGSTHEPINGGWIGKRGMPKCIRKINMTDSFRSRCVPGSNCETLESTKSRSGILHSTRNQQSAVQPEGVGAFQVCPNATIL